MPFSEIHHVTLTVSDLDRSIAFYRDVLGFKRTMDMRPSGEEWEKSMGVVPGTQAHAVFMQQGLSTVGHIELMVFDPPAEKRTGPKRAGDPGVFLLSFAVLDEELEAVYERLKEQGIAFYAKPTPVPLENFGTINVLVFEDPDGLVIELVKFPTGDEIRAARAEYRRTH